MIALFLSLLNENDKSKIEQIYNKYYSLMMYKANEILNDRALCEDAVCDSLEKIIRNLDKIEDISCYKTKSYIVIIVRNTAIDILRKNGRIDKGFDIENEIIVDTAPSLSDNLVSIEGYNKLFNIVNSLPNSLRETATLSFVHEFDYNEITEILGISYNAVKMRISRAREIAKSRLVGEKYDG